MFSLPAGRRTEIGKSMKVQKILSVHGAMAPVASVLKISICIVLFVLLGVLALGGSLFVFGSFFFETMRPSLVEVIQHIGLFAVGVLMISTAVYGFYRLIKLLVAEQGWHVTVERRKKFSA